MQEIFASTAIASVRRATSSGSIAITISWIGLMRVMPPCVRLLEKTGTWRVVIGSTTTPF